MLTISVFDVSLELQYHDYISTLFILFYLNSDIYLKSPSQITAMEPKELKPNHANDITTEIHPGIILVTSSKNYTVRQYMPMMPYYKN